MPNSPKPIFQKLTVNTAVTLLTCPSNTKYNVARLNICNIHATDSDTVEVWVTRSSVDIYEIKGVTIGIKTSFKIDGPIVLEAGDILKVKAATANRIDVVGSYLEIT
jgi:hypothetical protein